MREEPDKSSSPFVLKGFTFFVYGAMVLFATYFPLYLQDRGLNKLEIGLLLAFGPLVSIFANPFWGLSSDRYPHVRRIVLMMLTGTLLFAELAFGAHTYETLYTAMLLFYFCQTPLLAQTHTLTLSYISDTGRPFGSFRLWGSVGWALTALLAGPVLERAGISSLAFLFAALLGAAMLSLAALPPLSRGSGGFAVAPNPFRGIGRVIRNPYFLSFLIFGLLVSIPNTMNTTFLSLYITDMGGSRSIVGLAVFLSAFLEIGVLKLCERYLRRSVPALLGWLALVSLLFVFRWWLTAQATTPREVALIQIMHSTTFGGFFYVGAQLTRLLLPRPFRSSGHAFFTLGWSGIAGVAGGVLGGWLFQNFGAQNMYEFGGFLTLIGAVGFGVMWFFVFQSGYAPGSHNGEHGGSGGQ
ncbi:MFS transporter [Paenibacillus spiritus]|uniref:MFS transporter n=1 Tax=Paenibacillus spiritus TaxID=2496557 RepID=A0A5J5FWR4_9BACL|nr:MFS transporter [Paenibacillus spiritus]KAA8998378.1 MFS transporter [Paenibacillus spiritus]